MEKSKLGNRLRLLRKAKGMTLDDVSKETILSLSYISDLECGRTRPSLKTLTNLADVYGVSVPNLLRDTEFDNGLGGDTACDMQIAQVYSHAATELDKLSYLFAELAGEHWEKVPAARKRRITPDNR